MKRLVIVLLILAAFDFAFDRGAAVLGVWNAVKELGATIHRGIWASQ